MLFTLFELLSTVTPGHGDRRLVIIEEAGVSIAEIFIGGKFGLVLCEADGALGNSSQRPVHV